MISRESLTIWNPMDLNPQVTRSHQAGSQQASWVKTIIFLYPLNTYHSYESYKVQLHAMASKFKAALPIVLTKEKKELLNDHH